MKIIYSFNKYGYEASCWEREILAASDDSFEFIPFNHGMFLDHQFYLDAWSLDRLYRSRHPKLMELYATLRSIINKTGSQAIIVFNCPPYHPDFLRTLNIYKVLYSGDDPDSTYKRNIPYLHAYHHVFFLNPAYSADLDMEEKMKYCGMKNADLVPYGAMEYSYKASQSIGEIMKHDRDIDIIYVGSFFRQKLELIRRVEKAFGKRFVLHGHFKLKHNLYFRVKYGFGRWVRSVSFPNRTELYQRAKIGFNVHWNEYGLGNERLYHLPANGMMQICDCSADLGKLFEVGTEVVAYNNTDDLVDKLRYYLNREEERRRIAHNGYRRVIKEYKFQHITQKAARLIVQGMDRLSFHYKL